MSSEPRDGIAPERDGPLTIISIDRPAAKNALDAAAASALHAAFRSFERDDEARIAVLHGRHGCFCASADLKEMANEAASGAREFAAGKGRHGKARG